MAIVNVKWTQETRRTVGTVGAFVLIVLILVAVFQIPVLSGIANRIQSGFVRIGTGASKTLGRLTRSENALIVERDRYREQAASLSLDQAEFFQLQQDVEEMQALLAYKESAPYEAIASKIIARSEAGKHTILIDKGEVDGVRKRLAVVVEDGHMIGYVSSVRRNTSTVTLLEHESANVPAKIIGADETIGLVEGQGGFLLHMGFIPQRVDITESDVVVTSGLDGIFPQGLVIGLVDSVEKNATAAFQEAFVRPLYNADDFTNVLILDPFSGEL